MRRNPNKGSFQANFIGFVLSVKLVTSTQRGVRAGLGQLILCCPRPKLPLLGGSGVHVWRLDTGKVSNPPKATRPGLCRGCSHTFIFWRNIHTIRMIFCSIMPARRRRQQDVLYHPSGGRCRLALPAMAVPSSIDTGTPAPAVCLP